MNILRELNHPYIVKYQDRIIDKPKGSILNQNYSRGVIYIIMDFCPGGDLSQMIKRLKNEKYVDAFIAYMKFKNE